MYTFYSVPPCLAILYIRMSIIPDVAGVVILVVGYQKYILIGQM